MIRIPRKSYERRVLETLRREYIEADPELTHKGNRVSVERIEIDASGLPRRISILFREESRPGCLFGFQDTAVAPEWHLDPPSDTVVVDPPQGYSEPEDWANIFVSTYFMEQVEALGHGLPPECDPETVTWVTGYRDWDSVRD